MPYVVPVIDNAYISTTGWPYAGASVLYYWDEQLAQYVPVDSANWSRAISPGAWTRALRAAEQMRSDGVCVVFPVPIPARRSDECANARENVPHTIASVVRVDFTQPVPAAGRIA